MDLRYAEVEHLDDVVALPLAAGKEILGFDVAMGDPIGMRNRQRLADLQSVIDSELGGQSSSLGQDPAKVLSLQSFHDDERCAVGQVTDIEDARNVLAFDLGRDACFLCETSHELPVGKDFPAQYFDGHFVTESRTRRRKDEAHRSCADESGDRVLPVDDFAGQKWQVQSTRGRRR